MATFKTGDIVYVDFSPQQGHEQAGRRPALVVSIGSLYSRTGMVWVVPITSSDIKYPTHLKLSTVNGKITGSVLCEHIKSIDSDERNLKKVDEATEETISEVKKILDAILYIPK